MMKEEPPEEHNCKEYLTKARDGAGGTMMICVACEYHE